MQFTTTPTPVVWLRFRAFTNNGGVSYVGLSTVDSQSTPEIGYPLAAGDVLEIPVPEGKTIDLAKFWMDVETNNDAISYIALGKLGA